MKQLSFVLAFLSAFLIFAESEDETIAKCLRDLRSSDLVTRRAAALVIGKYDSDEAKAALLRCLKDPDASIRQSALVSLTEDERHIAPETGQAILRLLADEDVHIRRIASSLLDKALGGNRIIGSRIIIRGRLQQSEALQQPDTIECLNLALKDRDPSVRRNILLAAGSFPGVLQRENLESFFTSDSVELQALALRAYARCQGEEELRALQVWPLLKSPHDAARFELVYLAANLGEAGLPLLEELAKDPEAKVRLPAIGILANDVTAKNLARLKTALLDENVSAELRAPLISSLRHYTDQALPVCTELLHSASAALRVAALRMLAFQKPEKMPAQIFLDSLADNSPEARQLAMMALRRSKQNLPAEKIPPILQNPHADVRAFAFRLTDDPTTLLEMAQQSLLDDNPLPRKAALQVYARQRPEGFQEILLAALEDQEISIQEQAALSLIPFSRNQNVHDALEKYFDSTQNQQLKARLQKLLKLAPAKK
jgi:HEAT repeat protein